MSRLSRINNRAKSGQRHSRRAIAELGALQDQTDDDPQLPARRTKHPSNKQQMTKWFYNLLILLFIALVAGLLWYGYKKHQ